MKKIVRISVAAAIIAALPLAGVSLHKRAEERKQLIQFVDYCKGCENLKQVNKDIAKLGTGELKTIARWYESQDNFADCTDYPQQERVNEIIGRTNNK